MAPVMTTTTATQRPREFDARVIQWMPLLRKLANRLVTNANDRDDVVQDTIESALSNWKSFVAGNKFPGWLAWRMRGVISDRRRKRAVALETNDVPEHPISGNQEEVAELGLVLSRMADATCPQQTPAQMARANEIVLRVATGATLSEIAAEDGCSNRNVHQIYKARQRRLRDKFGVS